MNRAYKFALAPSRVQERMLRSHAGAARFAWNWGLARCKERYTAERKWYSAAELHGLWNAAKKGKARDSFRLTGTVRCTGDTVTVPRLGTVRTHEDTGTLAAKVEAGTARVTAATVSRTAQRWFVSFTVEEQHDTPSHHARPGSTIGIDLGVKTLLTGVDDQGSVITVQGPRPLRAALRRLRRAPRAHSRKRPGSARRRAAGRLGRLHARVAAVRADALHKATTRLAARYETVVVEDLNVTGMISNKKLARAGADQGFGTARRMLAYKTQRNGGTLVVADRWYPSSKTCSDCGSVKAKLTLADRMYACDTCGHIEDRDVNAARNLLSLAASGAERVNARGAAVRPGPAGPAVLKREPGTRPARRGKTGTAPQQCEAAARARHPALIRNGAFNDAGSDGPRPGGRRAPRPGPHARARLRADR